MNLIPHDYLQEYCDALIDDVGMRIVANDYNANAARGPRQTNMVHDTFQPPFVKPAFVIINCVSNSPSHGWNTVLVNEANAPGSGSDADWNAAFTRWRGIIDGVQAPRPELTELRLTANRTAVRFAFPGQRGRTNQVMGSSNLVHWTVLANFYGTNGPIVFRETNILANPRRFYRLRRL